jgi:ABC-type transport system involved in cytochrome c biogenesis permease subunit
MMKQLIVVLLLFAALPCFSQGLSDPQDLFLNHATQIQSEKFENIPAQDRGRIKPFHTLARESILFLTGSYKFFGRDPVQTYLALIGFEEIGRLKIVNVRHAHIRKALGLVESERYFSPTELERTPLSELAGPLLEKEQKNSRTLEPNEKHIIEIYNQYWFLKQIFAGEHLLRAIDANAAASTGAMHGAQDHSELQGQAKTLIRKISTEPSGDMGADIARLNEMIRSQPWPDSVRWQLANMDIEIAYNKTRPFFIAGLLFLLFGLSLILAWPKAILTSRYFPALLIVPFLPLLAGFYYRIKITGFAPVTNMYGTMLWVSFGIGIFSTLIWFLYRKNVFVGSLWVATSGILFLTESIPLVLSPDLDPIVAVLRSNLWLTIHVLTIVISYAAFAISMVLGNMVLIRSIVTGSYHDSYVQDAAKTCYRMIQLGVFLISVGIVLGGIWADYSWGRFWGWDPKETWALIADLGFLAILHARFVGWIGPFGVLASSTVGFLLVIMAWYGVNFILAAGLHSYGFSSGGAALMLTFVIAQMLILALALGLYFQRRTASKRPAS